MKETKEQFFNKGSKESEDKYNILYKSLPLPYQSLDKNGCLLDVNPMWLSSLGYTEEEVIGKFFKDFLHEDKKPIFEKNFPTLKKTGIVCDVPFKLKHKDGHFIDVLLNGNCGYYPDGSFRQTYCVFQDVTKRNQYEKEIKRFRHFFEESLNEIFLFDADTLKFTHVNKAAQKNLGYTMEELKELTPIDIKPNYTRASFSKVVSPLLKGEKEKIIFETVHQRKNQSIYNVEVHLQLQQYEDKPLFAAIILDITERKHAEDELKKSEERFKSLMQQSPFVVEIYNLEGLQIAVNKAYEELWNFPAETTVNKFNILKSKEVVDTGLILYVNQAYQGKSVSVPGYVFNPTGKTEAKGKGRVRWLSTKIYPLKNQLEKVESIVVIHQDITESKQIEQTLKDSEQFLKETQLIASLGIYTLNISTNTWTCSDVLDTIFGIDASYDKSVEGWVSLIHPEWQKIMNDYFINEVIGNKAKFDKEYKIVRHNDKTERWVHGIGTLKFDENNQPIKMIGTIEDITNRKQAEQKIKESESKFRNLFNRVADAIFIYDPDNFNILEANEATSKIYGYDKDELIGMSCLKFSEEVKKSKEIGNKIKKKGEAKVNIRHHKKKDGSKIIVQLHGYKVMVNDKEMMFAVCKDITEIKQAEQEKYKAMIRAEEKERQRLAHDLHDGLGQTIAAANMYINSLDDLVKNQLDTDTYSIFKTTKKLLNGAAKETRFVSHNIMPPSLKQFGLERSVTDFIRNYQQLQPETKFEINSTINTKRFSKEIELEMYRCIQEMINNTIKHAKAKLIKVELTFKDPQLIIAVIDDGVGFDYKKVVKKKVAGIGLVNLSHRINVIGGELKIDSKPSNGTHISIILNNTIELI